MKVNAYGNQPENISGRLLQLFDVWHVQSVYGTFPLSKALQSKPDIRANGAWVKAVEFRREIVD